MFLQMKKVFFLLSLLLIGSRLWAADKQPNILFILTDDQRWDSLGCYGNKDTKTPNIDRLASEGVLLQYFYPAEPLCCPSRATYLTGLYPHQTGILSNGSPKNMPDVPPGVLTIANYLQKGGYVTGFVGKAHLGGNPFKWGFQNCPVYLPEGSSPVMDPRLMAGNSKKKESGIITTIFADAAIQFLQTHKNEQWFLWLATTAPHKPFAEYSQYHFDPEKIKQPPGWTGKQEFKGDSEWALYYSAVSFLDQEIGRVLKTLDTLGLAENTLVILASDNGYMLGSHGIEGKEVFYEEASRVPGMIRWPGKVKPGTKSAIPFSSVDLLPTVLKASGAEVPASLKGVDIISTLSQPATRAVFYEVGKNAQCARKNQWKYVLSQSKSESLYNLEEDPGELVNLANRPASAKILEDMRKELQTWLKDTPQLPGTKIWADSNTKE